jgi:hypothetical protein
LQENPFLFKNCDLIGCTKIDLELTKML